MHFLLVAKLGASQRKLPVKLCFVAGAGVQGGKPGYPHKPRNENFPASVRSEVPNFGTRKLALAAKLSGPLIHDARIAAPCLHHGVRELWTANRDFSMFPQLKTRNPLVKK